MGWNEIISGGLKSENAALRGGWVILRMSPVDDFERDGLSIPSRYQGWLDVVVERLLSGVLKNIFRLTAVPKKNQRGREVTVLSI
jgi:hypothetical protein